jgi:hypothetical protein
MAALGERAMRVCITIGALLLSIACHPNRPVVDPGPRPDVSGTISGMVSDGAVPLGGRKVIAVNVETGGQVETSTTPTGGYTMRVPAGKYKLELELHSGETLATTPDPTEVDPGDLDAGRNFVVAIARR